MKKIIISFIIIIIFNNCYANVNYNNTNIEKNTILAISIPLIFIICYILIILEEKIKIKKSTISIFFATIMWIIITYLTKQSENSSLINFKIYEILHKYCELLIFLLITITYINVIKKTDIIDIIRNKIAKNNISYKKIYWTTGFLAFFISPIADNLTTALFASSILISMESKDTKFLNLATINIVIASNAGGVFSPFGDITTLMIWQNNLVNTKSFIYTFLPSFINFIIPAIIMNTHIEKKILIIENKKVQIKNKNYIIIPLLFIITIIMTTTIQIYLKIPAIIGMLLGFSLLEIFEKINNFKNKKKLNIHEEIKLIDWDTLLFFIGIMLCIGALSIIGVLEKISIYIYKDMLENTNIEIKHIIANTLMGILSAIIDNIPITYALIEMNPNMPENQWLILTLAVGTGGSILSIGSAAGIALMGTMNGKYTFMSHLKWSWSILLGYIISILAQILINKYFFM
ncbi:sodium:proton antiporter NhaD [Candidatus Azoamicus ciliaticola]|uniref:Na(+)/H(+) antiporter NhaD n=1 Tax=Candidatus Azoamicus ciliaticola TaxID=2652803 RepID=A0A6J5JY07_9GAMM|nr:sodium:proton antiporter NhaD [Candidatus Azoamicus ciliaticola]CAB3976471.1 Na(+)/H(+) antiporter NhaD [Candidatus Azoamicus ciliaticola]